MDYLQLCDYRNDIWKCEAALRIDSNNRDASAMLINNWSKIQLQVNDILQKDCFNVIDKFFAEEILVILEELGKMNTVKDTFVIDVIQLQTKIKGLLLKLKCEKFEEEYANNELLKKVKESGIQTEQITIEVLLKQFIDCFVFANVISLENYCNVYYTLEEDTGIVDEYKENGYSTKKFIGELRFNNDVLSSIINQLKEKINQKCLRATGGLAQAGAWLARQFVLIFRHLLPSEC